MMILKKMRKKLLICLKKIKDKDIEISYKNKKYFAPKSLLSLKKILKNNSNIKFLSGGTDLSLEVTKKRGEIEKIISLNSIKELKFIKKQKNLLRLVQVFHFMNFKM
jgi:xanthine dehydrogenase iron-sulfur cluster and FAD-binding subunit A